MKRIAAIPSILTLGNGFCGLMSIWYVVRAATVFKADPIRFGDYMEMAGWMVLLAMVFDALDGKIARMVKAETDFGSQLDSLADVVSFGVAPACMTMAMSAELDSHTLARLGWAAASIFTMCAMMRLARFNVESSHDSEGTMYFAGLPTPAAGGFVAALVMLRYNIEAMANANVEVADIYGPVPAKLLLPIMQPMAAYIPLLVLVLGILMITRVRYMHVLNKLLGDQEPFGYVIIVVIVSFFFFFTRPFSIPLAFLIYILWGLLGGFRSSRLDKKAEEALNDPQ
jgi:CDP-diacylglycerol--serine O-phosphatidyltransferase